MVGLSSVISPCFTYEQLHTKSNNIHSIYHFGCLLWTLDERRVRDDLIEVYKIMNGLYAVQFDSFLI